MLNKIAKIIRFLTVPPLVVAAVMTLLFCFESVFPQTLDFILTLLFLAVVPVLAYPLQRVVPVWRAGGQRMQRKLAFILTPIGYIGAVIASIVRNAIPNLLYISVVYLTSVLVLLLVNKLTPWHASGHGCSIAGPIVLLCCFMASPFVILPAIAVYALCFWASIHLKRHTVSEFLLGSVIPMLCALVCYFFIHPTF